MAKPGNDGAAKLLLGEGVSDTYGKILADTRNSLSSDALKTCLKNAGGEQLIKDSKGDVPSKALRGLVTLLALYLQNGNNTRASSVAKQAYFLMARTDFATMFKSIYTYEQEYFKKNRGVWVTFICKEVMSRIPNVFGRLEPLDPLGRVLGAKIHDYQELKEPIQIPVTRREWLEGMLDGHDLLSEKYAKEHMDVLESKLYLDVHGDQRLRGLGGLGSKMDSLIIHDLGTDVEWNAPVFEFRGPTYATGKASRVIYTDWKNYALDCYKLVYAVNQLQK